MADLLFVAISEDVERAESLAEMFEMAGLSIDSPFDDEALAACGAVVLVWSSHAARCGAFLTAAQRAIELGKAVVASLDAPTATIAASAPTFDLSHWNGRADAAALDDLFYAAYGKAMALRRRAEAEALRAEVGAANDNPVARWERDALIDATPSETPNDAAWSVELPDKPLPVAQTRAAPPTPVAPARKKSSRFLGITLGALAAVAIGATAYAMAMRADPSRILDSTPTTFAQLSMDVAP